MSRKIANDMLLVEHHSGESEMSDGEYERRLWREDQLRPATGGRVFTARTAGTGTFVVTWVRSTREREGQLFVAVLRNLVI
jgi:hypothetical protein